MIIDRYEQDVHLFRFLFFCSVTVKPEAALLTINRDHFEESQTVTMKCSSENGNPPPQYTWYRNGTLSTYVKQMRIFSVHM